MVGAVNSGLVSRMLLAGAVTIAVSLLSACDLVSADKPTMSTSIAPAAGASASVSPSPSPDSRESARPTPSPSASASASASAGSGAVAVAIPCSALVSEQTIYNFNPNFTRKTTFSPASGSAAAQAVANLGIACGWVNNTSSDTVTISVAKPGPATLTALKASASDGTAVAGLGDKAYFSLSGGVGRIDAFKVKYWLTATSTYFSSAEDAATLMRSAVSALP